MLLGVGARQAEPASGGHLGSQGGTAGKCCSEGLIQLSMANLYSGQNESDNQLTGWAGIFQGETKCGF